MINYGYFRHRLDASNDPKLQRIVDDMGIVALGYYFSLLEIYGQHYSISEDKNNVEIHRRVIANVWRKRVDSCDKVLTKLQLSGLLVHTKKKNTYVIDIPKFPKYYGSYRKKKEERLPNKSKVNKRKEKEIIYSRADSTTCCEIIDYLNEKSGKKFKPTTAKTKSLINARLEEKFTLEDFKKVIDIKCQDSRQGEFDEKYLRPETLFGTKFEGYLNQASEQYREPVIYSEEDLNWN